jgi:excisionase family DNA binding protein
MPTILEVPTPKAVEQAKAALRVLEEVRPAENADVTVEADHGQHISVVVPREAFEQFREILGHIANGNAVTIVPIHAEFTTQQAADFLNVSRPYLIGLLEAGKIRHHKVGTHRRIRFADLMNFKHEDDAHRRRVLDQLTTDAQELGLGY